MKSSGKNIGVISIVVAYCFAILAVIFLPRDVVPDIYFTNPERDFVCTDFTTTHFCNTPQLEVSVESFNNFSFPVLKKTTNNFWSVTKNTEIYFKRLFTHYTFILNNNPIQFWKSNIVFPFHYFW